MASDSQRFSAMRELAEQISIKARRLEQEAIHKDQVHDGEAKSQNGVAENETPQKTQTSILDDCRALQDLLVEPGEKLRSMGLVDKHNLITLELINHYSIASHVPLDGQISFQELAQLCDLPCDLLTRILHQSMTYNVFCEPEIGFIAHTPISKIIPSYSALLDYQFKICLPSAMHLVESLRQPPGQKKTPFQIAQNTDDNWWEFANKNGNWMELYGRYQDLSCQGGALDVVHILSAYDWEGLGRSTVVDIGGGCGNVSVALAEAFPELHLEIQDFPSLQSSYELAVPDQLRSRVTFTAHNFFDPQPKPRHPEYRNGERRKTQRVYLLRHILHDWPTPDCYRILRNLIPSMSQETRIIVAEQVMPSISYAASSSLNPNNRNKRRFKHEHEDDDSKETANGKDKDRDQNGTNHPPNCFNSAEQERIMRALDMQMLVQYGSQERSREDWERLLAEVGLDIVGMKKPRGSADTFMEVALK
ncbi:MAG: hypothetical protein Q9228_006931 [Teloschistes exilis]